MRIEATTNFLDGRDCFARGDVRTVSDERGRWFIANGWAVEIGAAPVTLQIHPATNGTKDTHHG